MPEKRERRKTLYTERKYLVVERINEYFIAFIYGENSEKGHAGFCIVQDIHIEMRKETE